MNIVFLQSVSLPTLALTFISVLGVSIVVMSILPNLITVWKRSFLPKLITVWKRFHPIRQEEMPGRFWYKVLKVIRKRGRVTLHLKEDRFPGEELFCALRQDDGGGRLEYREHVLSKHDPDLDLHVSFFTHRRVDGGTIWCMDYDYVANERRNTSRAYWRQKHEPHQIEIS